ncbi:DKNYY domain-containing protein [Haemophilus pittmaniae]|uniref:DKNYY domain-containing protein n=1 Tax=Haemophilus pittmaniae TaxID=249188 RepID=UPI0028DC2138|nr:DKNYY domain-containing protein [Haemophilus pittmaniae]
MKYPKLTLALFLILVFLCLYAFLMGLVTFISEEPDKFKELKGSEFYITDDDKVYAQVPSGGKFELIGAKASTFKYLNTGKYDNRNVGMSEDAVYCGNLVMRGLSPQSVRALGNGYFSDGKMTYFCDSVSEPNLDIKGVTEVWQILSHALFNTPKAQTHIYKFRPVDNLNLSPILGFGYAQDGEKAYYDGRLLVDAKASQLRYIDEISGRKSIYFTTDGENVYYKSAKLALKFMPEMRQIASMWNLYYLYEPNSGMVYANDHEFTSEFAPYTPLFSLSDKHSYHVLFRGRDGIYYWERKWQWYNDESEGEFVRAGDDPFKGEITPLFGDVIASSGETFFLRTYEIWRNNRSGRSLSSRNTGIFKLPTQGEWRRIGTSRNGVYGAVYTNGEKFYYFDEIGHNWHLTSSIYEIKEPDIVEILTRPYRSSGNLGVEDIFNMIKSGAMVPAKGEFVVEAISDFNDDDEDFWFGIFLLSIAIGSYIWAYYRKRIVSQASKKKYKGLIVK